MLKIYVPIIFLFFASLINGQEMKMIGPATGGAKAIAIHPQYPNIVYASNYVLFKSNDYGESCFPIEVNSGLITITNITLNPDDTNSIFLNIFDKSMKSENGGKDWELIYEHSGGVKNVYEFNPLNSNIIFMTRDEKELWRSDNNGQKWHLVNVFEGNLRDVKIAPSDTSVIYCAADYGIYRSNNSGVMWEKVSATNYYNSTKHITINPINEESFYFLLGNRLHISVDGGVSAQLLFEDGLNDYLLDPTDTLTIYLMADQIKYFDNNLIKTTDGGNNWNIIKNKIPERNFTVGSLAIDPVNSNTIYVSINYLGIYKSEDGGLNWDKVNLAYSQPYFIYPVENSNGQILYTNTGTWGLLKTCDNGDNWYQPEFDYYADSVAAYDITFNPQYSAEGFIIGLYYLFKTEDGGESWSKNGIRRDNSTLSYHPLSSEILFLGYRNTFDVFADAIISRSIDGGETWQNVKNIGKNTSVQGFVFHPSDSNVIYAYSSKEVFKSIDMGLTWDVKNNSLVYREERYAPISSLVLDINNPEMLYCSQIIDGGLSRTADGGETWKQIDSALYQDREGVSVSSLLLDKNNSERIFAFFSYPKIIDNEPDYETGLFLTEDGGKEWNKFTDIPVTKIVADNSTPRNIYLGSKFGIMTFVDTFKVTSVNDIEFKTISNNFILYQNYPNPFNPTTTLKYSISSKMKSEKTNVQLVVYDILGSKVKTLVNKVQQPGNYEIEFDAKSLTSGVYYYQIKVGSNTQTKKMVVLK